MQIVPIGNLAGSAWFIICLFPGHHLYCLKPKLKTVPSGDWYCSDCKPKERVRSPKKTVRRVFSSTEEDDTEEDEDSGQVKEEDSEEEEEDDEDFQAGLRIRIHIIRIRIQHFWLNTDPDPGLKWPKIEKNYSWKK